MLTADRYYPLYPQGSYDHNHTRPKTHPWRSHRVLHPGLVPALSPGHRAERRVVLIISERKHWEPNWEKDEVVAGRRRGLTTVHRAQDRSAPCPSAGADKQPEFYPAFHQSVWKGPGGEGPDAYDQHMDCIFEADLPTWRDSFQDVEGRHITLRAVWRSLPAQVQRTSQPPRRHSGRDHPLRDTVGRRHGNWQGRTAALERQPGAPFAQDHEDAL